MNEQTKQTVVFAEASGDVVFGQGDTRFRILAEAPDHPVGVVESTVPAGFPGPVRHRHTTMTDIFYVLEGVLEFVLGDERRVAGPGTFVLVPPGVEHAFSNPGSMPATFLNIYQPAGLEHYLKEVGRRSAAGTPPTPVEMAEIARSYDFVATPR